MIKSLGHVALGVRDLKNSIDFYKNVIGMEILMEIDIADDRMGRVIGIDGARCKIVHMKLRDTVLELFEYSQPHGINKACDVNQYDHGLIHIGFEVNDIHTHIRQLKQREVQFLGEAVEFRPDVWVVYFRGPDGEVCEFRQQPE